MHKKILGSHVQRLLSSVADHGNNHLAEIEADMLHACSLLEEATEKLSLNFIAIHTAVVAQQDAITVLLADGSQQSLADAKLVSMQGDVGNHVNAAITNMQFQDITSQLITHILKRVIGLRDLLGALGAHGEQLRPDSNTDQLVELLNKIQSDLTSQSLELRTVLRKVVSKQNLESGDVEMF